MSGPDGVPCPQSPPFHSVESLKKDLVGGGKTQLLKSLAYDQVDLGFIPRIHVKGWAWRCVLGKWRQQVFGAFWPSKLAYLEYEGLYLKRKVGGF